RRGAPDDLELLQTRERRDEFFRHAVGEILVSRVGGGIDQREHGNGFLGNGGALQSRSMEEEISRRGGKQNKDNDDFMPWNSLRFNDRRRSRRGRGNLAKLLRRLGIAQELRVKV